MTQFLKTIRTLLMQLINIDNFYHVVYTEEYLKKKNSYFFKFFFHYEVLSMT